MQKSGLKPNTSLHASLSFRRCAYLASGKFLPSLWPGESRIRLPSTTSVVSILSIAGWVVSSNVSWIFSTASSVTSATTYSFRRPRSATELRICTPLFGIIKRRWTTAAAERFWAAVAPARQVIVQENEYSVILRYKKGLLIHSISARSRGQTRWATPQRPTGAIASGGERRLGTLITYQRGSHAPLLYPWP